MSNFLGNLLGTLLKFVYDTVSMIGNEPKYFSFYAMAIIITTIIFKLILLPISIHQSKASKKIAELQPKLQEIQKKYKYDPQIMQAKTLELYREAKYNPASGCLILLIQIPIIYAFFKVMQQPTVFAFKDLNLYQTMNKAFLWISNLENPDPYIWGLPLLAGITTYIQSMTLNAVQDDKTRESMKIMNTVLPVFIFLAARSFPAGLALYWVVSNIFSIIQQLISIRSLPKVKEEK